MAKKYIADIFETTNGDDLVADVAILSNGIDAFSHAKRVSESGGTTIDIIPLDEVIRASRGSASLLITPNSIATSKVFSQLPDSSAGDFPFVRASTATQINKYGVLETVSAGVPRRDYTNGVPALLIEPQRTNLFTYSEQFDNAYWSKTNIILTPNNKNSPNGSLTADLVLNSLSGAYINNASIIGSTGSVYTFSFYIKNNTSTSTLILIREGSSALSSTINWSGNTISSISNSIGSMNFIPFDDGWYKITGTYTALENNQQLRIYPQSGGTTNSVYLWGAQLEVGSYATSYIQTVASTVTRVADTMSKTGISDLIGQSEGTMYCEIKNIADDNIEKHITLSDGTNNNKIDLFYGFYGVGKIYYEVKVAGVVQGGLLNGSLVVTNINKIAIIYKTNRFELWINGTKISQDLIGTTFSGNTLSILKTSSPNGTNPFYGNINSIQLYKTALTDAQLTALTTL